MKNPKKNQKTPFTRRQFVGRCAVGASMIGLAPYMPLTGSKVQNQETTIDSNVCDKVTFETDYSKGTIEIRLNFPKPRSHEKELLIDDGDRGQKIKFDLLRFCKSGFITYPKEGGGENYHTLVS